MKVSQTSIDAERALLDGAPPLLGVGLRHRHQLGNPVGPCLLARFKRQEVDTAGNHSRLTWNRIRREDACPRRLGFDANDPEPLAEGRKQK